MMVCSVAAEPVLAAIVHASDFIDDGTRTHFNGFESIPAAGGNPNLYDGESGPYAEDTIQVRQINGDVGESIWVTNPYGQGSFSWYPNGGDNGYTELSLTGGGDFQDVGFNFWKGTGHNIILYELLNDGLLVMSGTSTFGTSVNDSYLGFSGGGFDTILVRSGVSGSTTFYDSTFNALVVDSIETQGDAQISSVPEPSIIALLGIGLAGAARRRMRQTPKG